MLKLFKGPFYMGWRTPSSGVGFFCFHALGDTKQKKPTPLNRGPPLHVNRVLKSKTVQLVTFMVKDYIMLHVNSRAMTFENSLNINARPPPDLTTFS